jgi:hypothetical protein
MKFSKQKFKNTQITTKITKYQRNPIPINNYWDEDRFHRCVETFPPYWIPAVLLYVPRIQNFSAAPPASKTFFAQTTNKSKNTIIQSNYILTQQRSKFLPPNNY